MYSLLLKKALPFALTLIIGSLIGGLFNFFFGTGGYTPMPARPYFYSYGEGHGHSCRMRARGRYLVAETKPLAITFKPDAVLPLGEKGMEGYEVVTVSVTFGADGEIQRATPIMLLDHVTQPVWDAAERAARQIRFEPETVNGIPVTVTREVKIRVSECSGVVDYSTR